MKFIKNHLISIIITLAGIALFALSVLSKYFATVGMVCFSVASCIEFFRSKQNSDRIKEESSDENLYFDATTFDYDEDVYYIGEDGQKPKFRSKFSKFIATGTGLLWIFMAVGFAVMAVYSIIKF